MSAIVVGMSERDIIQALLRHRDSIVLRRELTKEGMSDKAILEARRRGEIHGVTRGAYAGRAHDGVDDHRHLLSLAALRLYPDAQLAGAAAVAAWEIPVTRVPAVRLDIVRPVRREVLTKDLRIRPRRVESRTSPLGPADPPAVALIQMTRDVGVLPGVAAIDAALHAGKVTEAELVEELEVVKGWPASSLATCALAWADGRSESVGESLTRAHLRAAGIMTTPQVDVRDRDGSLVGRVDLMVDGRRVIVEFDGKIKYAEGGAEALFREKRREDRLRRLGYVVVRVVWADLYRPEVIVARVREAIATAA